MAVPDYQTVMRPLLEEYATGGEQRIADVRGVLATRFELTEEELAERLPSRLAKTFDNRVGWAATYLYRVGLLARAERSVYAITERGREVLGGEPGAGGSIVCSRSFPSSPNSERGAGRRRQTRASGATPVPVDLRDGDTRGAHRRRLPGVTRGTDRGSPRQNLPPFLLPPPSRISCSTCSMRWVTGTAPNTPDCALAPAATPGSMA